MLTIISSVLFNSICKSGFFASICWIILPTGFEIYPNNNWIMFVCNKYLGEHDNVSVWLLMLIGLEARPFQ